jgi:hypothetical protein
MMELRMMKTQRRLPGKEAEPNYFVEELMIYQHIALMDLMELLSYLLTESKGV